MTTETKPFPSLHCFCQPKVLFQFRTEGLIIETIKCKPFFTQVRPRMDLAVLKFVCVTRSSLAKENDFILSNLIGLKLFVWGHKLRKQAVQGM